MKTIIITIDGERFQAELDDNATAQQVYDMLPLEAAATRWGDEFYFSIPIELEEAEDAQSEVAIGTLAYWPPGNAFCIFFGPTPVSQGNEPRAYSPVNIFGHLLNDIAPLQEIRSGAQIQITVA